LHRRHANNAEPECGLGRHPPYLINDKPRDGRRCANDDNGQVHFRGVGLVRYDAEREAQIAQILASDPEELQDGNREMRDMALLKDYFAVVAAGVAAVKTSSTR
jgi:hypothetical protein